MQALTTEFETRLALTRLHQNNDDARQASYCVFSQRLGRLGELSALVLYQSIEDTGICLCYGKWAISVWHRVA